MSDFNVDERLRKDRILSAQYGVDSPSAREFGRARKRAFVNDIFAFLRGYRNQLLAFDELSETIKDAEPVDLGLQEVRLDAIRGSMDRYRDFDLAFLPKHSGMRERWQRVATARQHGLPTPPVDLYKLGNIYFVRDGHHRISVCRSRATPTSRRV